MKKILFKEMELSEEIKRAVEELGFEEATAIQTACIPLIKEGRDVIGHSQTGTGKTAAFSIPALELIDPANQNVQVIILCPTRELAVQACDEVRKFAKYMHGIKTTAVFGGQPIERQFKALKTGAQIVVGTPGRVMDHMRRKTLKLDYVKMAILDEADEMLSMGFRDDIETILQDTPQERQTMLFSATMSREILELTKKYQRDPELVKITREQLTVPNIEQIYYEVPQNKKVEVLTRVMDFYNPGSSMVFCNTKRQVDELVSQMQLRGYLADGLHGDMKQQSRQHVLDLFRSGQLDVLVATDVAARGIDVDNINAVFNYDVPQDEEYYVHRIGRTGRAGKEGKAFTFVTGRREFFELRSIMNYTKSKIELKAIPSSTEVMDTKISKFKETVKKVIEEGELEKYMSVVNSLIEEDYTSADIASALIKLQMDKDGKNSNPEKEDDKIFASVIRRNDRVANSNAGKSRSASHRSDYGRSFEQSTRRPRPSSENMVQFTIDIGRNSKVAPNHILGALAGETGLSGKTFGRIEIYPDRTTVEVPKEHRELVLSKVQSCKIIGKKVSITESSNAERRDNRGANRRRPMKRDGRDNRK